MFKDYYQQEVKEVSKLGNYTKDSEFTLNHGIMYRWEVNEKSVCKDKFLLKFHVEVKILKYNFASKMINTSSPAMDPEWVKYSPATFLKKEKVYSSSVLHGQFAEFVPDSL